MIIRPILLRVFLIAIFAACLFASCASFLQNDESEVHRTACPFSVRSGVQVWDDSTSFPFSNVEFVDEVEYEKGLSSRELEDKAVTHAQVIKADGIFIFKRSTKSGTTEVDVGKKRADLDIHGFNLEEHGVELDTLHYSKNVNMNPIYFDIRVRFFKYRNLNNAAK